MKKYYMVFIALYCVLSACQRHTIPVISSRATDPPAPVHAVKVPGADPATGKIIFQDRCMKCHALPDPGQYTVQRWEGILQRMIPKAKLDASEGEALKIYIRSVAAK